MFDLIEETFDEVALLVDPPIAENWLNPVGLGWDHDDDASFGQMGAEGVIVECLVRKDMFRGYILEQGFGLRGLVRLTGRQNNSEGITKSIDSNMNFRA